MRIQTRLLIAFVILAFIGVIGTALASGVIREVDLDFDIVSFNQVPGIIFNQDVISRVYAITTEMAETFAHDDADYWDRAAPMIEALRATFEEERAYLRGEIDNFDDLGSVNDEDFEHIARLEAGVEALVVEMNALIERHFGADGRRNDVAYDDEAFEESLATFIALVDEQIADNLEEYDEIAERADEAMDGFLAALPLIMSGVTVISIGISFYLARFLSGRLSVLADGAARIAAGDYTTRLPIKPTDEVGRIALAFNSMADSVRSREVALNDLNLTLEKRVRQRTQEAEAARRIAEENNRLKSEFLATMSHELRTPLNAIEGFTSIVRNRMAGVEVNDKADRIVGRIEENSKRLLGLINDFLDLSRIESGRMQLVQVPFMTALVVEGWSRQIASLVSAKNLTLETTIAPDLPAEIIGDQEAVSKIALNLLGNAIKFTDSGKVSLTLRRHGESYWQLVVQDTGIGIPPHAREYIFDEFRQVDASTTRRFGGTGLGLAIVQKLARAMNGTVAVESEVGAGSTFTVTLPLLTEIVAAVPMAQAS